MNSILYVTGNEDKFSEAKELLPSVQRADISITEIQGSPEKIIRDKVAKAYRAVKQPCLVDDASLMIDDLGGSPGPYVKNFLDGLTSETIGDLFHGSRAEAKLFLGYRREETTKVFSSSVDGRIVQSRGDGWGYEPVFEPDGYDRTWAELTTDEIKHRAKALKKLRSWLA